MTPEQQSSYKENGYLVVSGLFDPEELEAWAERLLAVVEGEVTPATDLLVMRDVMVAKGAAKPERRIEEIAKLQDLYNDPVLMGYIQHPRLLDWVERLIGSDFKAIHSMLINKPPNLDGRHPLHQDLLYFPFRPADAIVCAWTALERMTRESGCLAVVPGSHRGELLPHEDPDWEHVNYLYLGARGVVEHTERVHLEMEPGETVLFHPLLLHGSGCNRSQGFRRAISAHYGSCRCQYLEDANPLLRARPKILVRGRECEDGI